MQLTEQITFSEDDVKSMKEFARFISERAKFDGIDWPEAIQLAKYYPFLVGVIKKMDAHVMGEPRIIASAPPESETKKTRSRSK